MQPPVFRTQDPEALAARMSEAFSMHTMGMHMLRCRLQRLHPAADEEMLRDLACEEVHRQPGSSDHVLKWVPCTIR